MNKKTTDQIKNNIRYYGNLKKQMELSETKVKPFILEDIS